MFAGLRSWGLDSTSAHQVKKIRGRARLSAWGNAEPGRGNVEVTYDGEAYRQKCVSGEKVTPANRLHAGVVICRSLDVCHAMDRDVRADGIDGGLTRRRNHEFPNTDLISLAAFLEDNFPYVTRGMMTMNIAGMQHVAQPRQFDTAFLDVKPFADWDCSNLNPADQPTCESHIDRRYREFLREKSKVRFYFYEAKNGKTNDPAMYDEVRAVAQQEGWNEDTQILMVVPNAKFESLGVYFQGKSMGVYGQPYEQFRSRKPIPYETRWRKLHHLADGLFHEIGHGFGLGHDCEDADGNAFDCDNDESLMAHRRDRPIYSGENWVNQFSECALDFIRERYLATTPDGGARGSTIADYECN